MVEQSGRVLRRGGGVGGDECHLPAAAGGDPLRRRDPGYPALGTDSGDHPDQRGPLGGIVDDRDDLQRPVEAGPEAACQHVVGLPGGTARRIVALVGRSEREGGERHRDDDYHANCRDRRSSRAPGDQVRPAGPEPSPGPGGIPRAGGSEAGPLPARNHLRPDEAEQGGQEGE